MTTAKRNKRLKEDNQSSSVRLTVYLRIPTVDARASFRKKLAKTDESNPALDAFLMVMNHFTTNVRSWTRQDVHYYSRPYSLEFFTVEDLLTKFVEHFASLGKLEIVDGCYGQPIFVNV